MFEYTLYCLACSSHTSQGGLETPPQLSASDVLSLTQHNPGCDLSHPHRSTPVVKKKQEGIVTIYTIYPGAWKDAEMLVE